MKNKAFSLLLSISVLLIFCTVANAQKPAKKTVSLPVAALEYDRDIRPILSENCFKCHGYDPAQRQAGLRLDEQEGAYAKQASGKFAINPGKPEQSEALNRIYETGALHMPPAGTGKKITPAQAALLKKWISQGGKYQKHWAFVTPLRPKLPTVKDSAWGKNSVDKFILAKLEASGLKPSPEADRATLLRRATFDLTGLPATPQELQAFLADKSPNAYEKQIDRLLASPHYGERMANSWLDLARYADTHGFHIDSQREMWKWREWVIDAFNSNMGYDQFTIEQLAGDLLPNPTLSQKIATGFNRNHPINFEGGAIPEEYQTAYIVDRIDTTATTWMGLTMRCAQCHTHKYDPISNRDYYRFYAFFNNVPEQGLDGQTGNAVPYMKAPTFEQQAKLDSLTLRVADAEKLQKARRLEAAPAYASWEKGIVADPKKIGVSDDNAVARFMLDESAGKTALDSLGKLPPGQLKGGASWAPGKIGGALKLDGTGFVDLGDSLKLDRDKKFSYGAWVYLPEGGVMTVLSKMDDAHGNRGWDLYLQNGTVFVHLIHDWDKNVIRVNSKQIVELKKWTHVFVTYDGSSKAKGVKIYLDGKPADLEITHDTLTDTIQTPVSAKIGARTPAAPFKGMIDDLRIYERELAPKEVEILAGFEVLRPILALAPDKRTEEQKKSLETYFLEKVDAPYQKISADLAAIRKSQADADAEIPTTMVMQEMPKTRDTFMLLRGAYDKKGEKVTPGLPEFLVQAPAKPEAPKAGVKLTSNYQPPAPAPEVQPTTLTRLDLAKWLVSGTHPLTGRVAVNRYWQMIFGTGLLKSAEDFGTQGGKPSHPELLDWLATEFVRTKWDIKGMMKLLVTTAAYRQTSRTTKLLQEKDPENLLLARGPRFRLPAEAIRDQALAIGGLLVPTIGGQSVHTYQPVGLWEDISFKSSQFSAQIYVQDHGDSLYRRSMYTFWKRTVPPPSLQTFDAPEREFCIVRRSTTNTPLQALVLMNDPTYTEAARKWAERLMLEGGATPEAKIDSAFRTALLRNPMEAERKIVSNFYKRQLALYQKDNLSALKLLGVGEAKRNETLDPGELAAWTAVCGLIFNMDETITKN